jgi:hypothetical protein
MRVVVHLEHVARTLPAPNVEAEADVVAIPLQHTAARSREIDALGSNKL